MSRLPSARTLAPAAGNVPGAIAPRADTAAAAGRAATGSTRQLVAASVATTRTHRTLVADQHRHRDPPREAPGSSSSAPAPIAGACSLRRRPGWPAPTSLDAARGSATCSSSEEIVSAGHHRAGGSRDVPLTATPSRVEFDRLAASRRSSSSNRETAAARRSRFRRSVGMPLSRGGRSLALHPLHRRDG